MTVKIEMTPDEAAEYLRFRKNKTREQEEIADLFGRLESIATMVYKALVLSEESGVIEVVNEGYAEAALNLAEKVLF